jgi:flavin-dependent dehydrogenase
MSNRFDIVVIGAGPAGCVTAMLLARSGCSVAIVDRPPTGRFRIGETLPPQASRLLADLDLTQTFLAQQHRPSPGLVSVWGSAEPSANDFLFSPHGCGWHIDRPKFNAMLLEAATIAGAAFFAEARIAQCMEEHDGWCICVSREDHPRTLKCRFIVDASGRRSAGAFGFPPRIVLDRLIAIAGLAHPARSAHVSDYTLVEAVEDGWFYTALLPCGDYILAYLTDADIYAAGRQRSISFLENQLSNAPHTRERVEQLPPNVALFSAITTFRNTVLRRNWIAVGDAARSYDPLSGLGLWTAMKTASEAAPVIIRLLEGEVTAGIDYELANRQAFAQYRKARRTYYGLERRWPQSEFWLRRHR